MRWRARNLVLASVVVVAVVAVLGGSLWRLLGADPPDEVSLAVAVAAVEADGNGRDAPAVDGISGTWVVENETGEVGFERATGTFAGFRIEEELASVGRGTAVGRTSDVTGTAAIEGTTLTAATIEVDMSSLTTDERRRDSRVQDALATDTHPVATFTLTDPVELGPPAAEGGPVSLVAPGELTLRGAARHVEFPLEAQLVGDTIVVVGALDVAFSDYDVEVPRAPLVLSVEDHATVELQLRLVHR